MLRLVARGVLDQDLDAEVVDQLVRVRRQQPTAHIDLPWLLDIAHQDPLQAQLDAGPARELWLPGEQSFGDLATHRAETDEPDIQCAFGHGCGLSPLSPSCCVTRP